MSTPEPQPQWIVSSREDGQNVNDWHWVEHDCVPFLRRTAAERTPRGFEPCEGAKLEAVPEVTGEATANNRRGKTIFLYELEFTYRLSVPGGHTVTVHFPYVGEDNEDDEYEAKVTCAASADARDTARARAVPALRAAIRDVIATMKTKYTKPKSSPSPVPTAAAAAATAKAEAPAAQEPAAKPAPKPVPAVHGDEIRIEERFTNASPKELFECLMDARRVSAMTCSEARIEARAGAKFEYFGGAVTGEIVDLVPGERIVQTWRFSSWPAGQSSFVEISMRRAPSGDTLLELRQRGVPHDDRERTEHGWREKFFDRMRTLFGYGGLSSSQLAAF